MTKTVVHKDDKTYFGEEDYLSASQKKSFTRMIFELLSEKTPTRQELEVFELILNLSIDHGPETPSAIETIKAAKEGKTISESVSEGIKKVDDIHGGAQEELMRIFYEMKEKGTTEREAVEKHLAEGKRVPGYGHRIYKVDPRAQLILKYLEERNLGTWFIGTAKGVERELNKQTEKTLPLNIDGAIAIALCAFDWKPNLGKAVFIVARTPGLTGQYLNNS